MTEHAWPEDGECEFSLVNYVELDGHRVEAVNDANPGDRQYLVQSNNEAAREAAARCGRGEKCKYVRRDLSLTLAFVSLLGDSAKGSRESTAILARALRRGSSFAGRNLKRAAALSRRVSPLARGATPLAVAAAVLEVTGKREAVRAAVRVAGGYAGAAAGTVACRYATRGAAPLVCVVAVPAGGVAGERFAVFAFDRALPK